MPSVVPSIATLGDGAFAAAASHMPLTFAAVLKKPPLVERRGHLRAITGEPHPLGNFAMLTDPADLDSAHDAVHALLDCPAPSAVIALSAPTQPVEALLAEVGFEGHGGMPAMAVDISNVPATPLAEGCEFIRMGAGEGDMWSDALAVGYDLPNSLARLFSPSALGLGKEAEEAIQCYAIVREGRAVATSMLHLADGLAGIYCVATLPGERGKGLGAYVTAEPLRLAAQMGYRVGVLQSSTDGYSVYKRLGFVDLGGMPFYVRIPA